MKKLLMLEQHLKYTVKNNDKLFDIIFEICRLKGERSNARFVTWYVI